MIDEPSDRERDEEWEEYADWCQQQGDPELEVLYEEWVAGRAVPNATVPPPPPPEAYEDDIPF